MFQISLKLFQELNAVSLKIQVGPFKETLTFIRKNTGPQHRKSAWKKHEEGVLSAWQ